jgi:hypothetical protein
MTNLDEFKTTVKGLLASGRTRAELVSAVYEAERELGDGCFPSVHEDQTRCVVAQPPIARGEAKRLLPEGAVGETPPARDPINPIASEKASQFVPNRVSHGLPPARDPIPGEDHTSCADDGRSTRVLAWNPTAAAAAIDAVPVRAHSRSLPGRDPTPGFIRATIATNQAIARSILDRVTTTDGRLWGDVRPYEISGMQRDAIRGMALLSVCGSLDDRQTKMTFRELISPKLAAQAFENANKELSAADA